MRNPHNSHQLTRNPSCITRGAEHADQAANIRARHAACLAYALRPMTDAQLQADIAWLSSELGVDDELDVFGALDDLMAVLEH